MSFAQEEATRNDMRRQVQEAQDLLDSLKVQYDELIAASEDEKQNFLLTAELNDLVSRAESAVFRKNALINELQMSLDQQVLIRKQEADREKAAQRAEMQEKQMALESMKIQMEAAKINQSIQATTQNQPLIQQVSAYPYSIAAPLQTDVLGDL